MKTESKYKCKCSMRIKLVGDGCRYCNPQYYISLLERQTEDDQKDLETLSAEVTKYREWFKENGTNLANHRIGGFEFGEFVLGKQTHD